MSVSTSVAGATKRIGAPMVSRETMVMAALLGAGFLFAFWPLVASLGESWFGKDTYYAHGAIVPLCSAFMIYDRMETLRKIPRSSFWLALAPFALFLYAAYVS